MDGDHFCSNIGGDSVWEDSLQRRRRVPHELRRARHVRVLVDVGVRPQLERFLSLADEALPRARGDGRFAVRLERVADECRLVVHHIPLRPPRH